MFLIINTSQFNINNIYFSDTISNSVIDNALFSKIFFSDDDIIITGVYIKLDVDYSVVTTEKRCNKCRCTFDTSNYKILINTIRTIEDKILSKFSNNTLVKQHKIYDTIKNGLLHLHILNEDRPKSKELFLKISGVWSNNKICGITHKFFC